MAQMLQMGDEGHNRNRAGSLMALRDLLPSLITVDAPSADVAEVVRFVGEGAVLGAGPRIARHHTRSSPGRNAVARGVSRDIGPDLSRRHRHPCRPAWKRPAFVGPTGTS